jgi:4-amino-4-deoxy-L-arabinose transferase-like glycosyltransferase
MKRSALLALLLVFLAMIAATQVSRHTFERLPHLEDEFAYLFQARIFQHGDVYIQTPEPNRAYWQPFLINLDGKRFGKYPPGYPLILAIGTAMNLPWVVNLWLGGLTVALAYRVARELYDETAGVIAALLMTISPIAILMNATLMSHTAALFFGTVFMYSLWRVERGHRAVRWGFLAGASLGMMIATRPLAAVGMIPPFVLYSGLRLLWAGLRNRPVLLSTLKPLLAITAATLLFGSLYPLFNAIVSGSPTTNLYTYIWKYDRIGFGEGYGRYQGEEYLSYQGDGIKIHLQTHAGHSLKRGWKVVKKDSQCYFRDLFGWTEQPDAPPTSITVGNECLVDRHGLSWIWLPFGILLMRRRPWSVMLLGAGAGIILIHITYWIGAGVYSARYYFEATAAFAILSGAGVSALAKLADRMQLRYGVYALLGILVSMSVLGYTPWRVESLQGYGRVTRDPIEAVEKLRYTPDTPVLVIASGKLHWRDLAPFMALTDPYASNPIIGLRDPDQTYSEELMAQHPDRQVIFLIEGGRLVPVDIPGRAGYDP